MILLAGVWSFYSWACRGFYTLVCNDRKAVRQSVHISLATLIAIFSSEQTVPKKQKQKKKHSSA